MPGLWAGGCFHPSMHQGCSAMCGWGVVLWHLCKGLGVGTLVHSACHTIHFCANLQWMLVVFWVSLSWCTCHRCCSWKTRSVQSHASLVVSCRILRPWRLQIGRGCVLPAIFFGQRWALSWGTRVHVMATDHSAWCRFGCRCRLHLGQCYGMESNLQSIVIIICGMKIIIFKKNWR